MIFFNTKLRSRLVLVFAVFLFALNANIHTAKAETGTDFIIDPSYDLTSRSTVTATDRFNSQNAYFYVEDTYWNALASDDKLILTSNLSKLGDEFDNVIYPTMRQFYGSEWRPGIDNDPKIYILLTNIVKDAGGYYNPNDEYYKNQVKDGRSNEKEIIYLNVNFADKADIKPFLAHEFQHMINWYQKKVLSTVDEEVWLNEAMSEYSYSLLGYDNPFPRSINESRTESFLENPTDSLTEWKNNESDYAAANMFVQFLTDRYGKDIIKHIIASKKTGIEAINDALQKSGFPVTFSDVFANWVITNYINNKTLLDGKYAYLSPNLNYDTLHVKPEEIISIKPNTTVKNSDYTKDWSGKWYQFVPSGINNVPNQTLKISFDAASPTDNFKIPYLVKYADNTLNIGFLLLDAEEKGTAYINNFGTAATSVIFMPISEKKHELFTDSEPMVNFNFSLSLVQSNNPVIKNITPSTSNTNGGTMVTITGENFTPETIVKFGGIPAIGTAIQDSKTIIAQAPPYPEGGNVPIEIINLNSLSATSGQLFTYLNLAPEGSLVRAEGDFKVYVIKGKYKRWIQSPKIFNMYNFKWSDIITVSGQVRDYYENSKLVRTDGDYKVYEINQGNIKHHLDMTGEQFSASGRSWDAIFIINKFERNLYKTGPVIKN